MVGYDHGILCGQGKEGRDRNVVSPELKIVVKLNSFMMMTNPDACVTPGFCLSYPCVSLDLGRSRHSKGTQIALYGTPQGMTLLNT